MTRREHKLSNLIGLQMGGIAYWTQLFQLTGHHLRNFIYLDTDLFASPVN